MLASLGDLLEDVVVHLASAPRAGTDTPARIDRTRGGSAANVAAAAVFAGAPARFIGRVGDDALGRQLAARLAVEGVDVRVQRGGRTGSVVVLVGPDGERTMLADRAAATELTDIDHRWLTGVTWLHVPAYSLVCEPIGTCAVAAASAVAAAGGRVSVDLSSVAVVEEYGVERFNTLVGALAPDVVFANADEERLCPDEASWVTVVKRGADPVVVRRPNQPDVGVPVAPVLRVVDSTGAGDSFAAGYIAARLAGADEVSAAERGSALAALTLHQAGARLSPSP